MVGCRKLCWGALSKRTMARLVLNTALRHRAHVGFQVQIPIPSPLHNKPFTFTQANFKLLSNYVYGPPLYAYHTVWDLGFRVWGLGYRVVLFWVYDFDIRCKPYMTHICTAVLSRGL